MRTLLLQILHFNPQANLMEKSRYTLKNMQRVNVCLNFAVLQNNSSSWQY